MIISKIEEKIQQLENIMLNKTIKNDNSLIHQIINEEQVERKNQKINEKIYKVATFIQQGNLMNCLLLYLIYYY